MLRRSLISAMMMLLAWLTPGASVWADPIYLHGKHALMVAQDDPSFADPSYDDSAWPRIEVPSSLRAAGVAGRPDLYWYRITFEVPADWHNQASAVRLGILSRSDETYLNGVRIGGHGIVGPAESDWHAYAPTMPRLYAFDPSLLRPGQRNVLAIRGAREPYLDDGGMIAGPVALMKLQDALPEHAALSARFDGLRKMLSGIETLIAIVLVGCIIAGIRSRLLLLYQLLFLPSYVFFLEYRGVLAMLGFESQLLQFLANISGALALPLLLEIFAHAFDRPVGIVVRGLQALSVISLISIPNTGIDALDWWVIESNLVWHGLMFIALGVICGWSVQALLQRKLFSGALFTGILMLTICLAIDLVFPLNFFEVRIGMRITEFGMLALFLSLGFVVLQSFAIRERRLLAANAQIGLLHEQDRARMANDVHDGIGQWLGAIKVKLDLLNAQPTGPDNARAPKLSDVASDVEQVIEDTRRLAHDLAPGLLDQHGLVGAMQANTRHLKSVIDVSFQVDVADDIALGGAAQIQVYRIFQEAISNTVKHSGAEHARIRVQQNSTQFLLEISDNGTWTRQEFLEADAAKQDGLGLKSMFNRASLLGATLRIGPGPAGGTTVTLNIPIDGADRHG